MRRLIPLLLFCSLFLYSPVVTQAAPSTHATPQDDSAEPSEEETSPELPSDDAPDSAANNEEDTDDGQGKTSWERLNAERQPEVAPSPAEEPPDTFSPLVLWRMIRGLWSKD
jgi:hypothetical protein